MANARIMFGKISVFIFVLFSVNRQILASKDLIYESEDMSPVYNDISVISLEERHRRSLEERHRRQVTGATAQGSTTPTPAPTSPPTTTPRPVQTTSPDLSEANIIHDDHSYYESLMFKSNIEQFWVQLDPKHDSHTTLSNNHRTAVTAKLPFNFPFYGHPISNVTIATGGFLYMSPFLHQWLTATQYIAPLMANFDTGIGGNDSLILFKHVDKKFVVEWRDVHLQDQNVSSPGTNTFHFQVILHLNGSIIFVYKTLPINVPDISDKEHKVAVGLSDAFYFDSTTPEGTKRRTIYEYHRVVLNTTEIREGTVVILNPQPTCNRYADCESCVSSNINFECRWCGIIDKCSDSVDWHRQEWLNAGCVQLSGAGNCSMIATRAPKTERKKSNVGTQVAIIVIVIVLVVVLVGAVGGWVYYAYTHPTSASGMWLMEHRPSQMKAKMANMKFWKSNGTSGDKYAVESTA